MNYIVRKAQENDLNSIMKLRELFAKELGVKDKTSIKFVSMAMLQYLKTNDNYSLYVAEIKNKIVANALVNYYKIPPSTANITGVVGYVSNVYILKKYRGQGIGTALMDAILKDAIETGAGKVELLASREGIKLYKKFGFKKDDQLIYMKKFI